MARTTTTMLTITESYTGATLQEEDVQRVMLTLDNTTWALDLTADSLKALQEALTPFTSREQPLPAKTSKSTNKPRQSEQFPPGYLKAARAWAWEAGMTVAPQGVVPKAVLAAYALHLEEEAQTDAKPEAAAEGKDAHTPEEAATKASASRKK